MSPAPQSLTMSYVPPSPLKGPDDERELSCWLDAPLLYPDFIEGLSRLADRLAGNDLEQQLLVKLRLFFLVSACARGVCAWRGGGGCCRVAAAAAAGAGA